MRFRGMIEGFYGPPWSHAERLEMIRFCGRERLNTWVHAPKDDPYHRKLWREPYPDEELAQIAELVAEAERCAVEFAYAIAPGLSICYSSDDDFAAVLAKCEQVRSAGVRSFQLLWDDIEHTFSCEADDERYGSAERPSGAAHCEFTNRFHREFRQERPLVVCPIGYAGTGDSPYRRCFAPELDPEIVVYWTGPEVVSLGITREALNTAVPRFRGHELLLWDNYPVNDFEPARLFLGPLLGRDPRLAEGRCAGLIANAMVQAIPSKLGLATVADWTRDPAGYDPVASFERALREHGAEVVEALRALSSEMMATDTAITSGVMASYTAITPDRLPEDVPALVEALELGVDAATGLELLEPFV